MKIEHWGYSVQYCNAGYTAFCICQNPYNIQHHKLTLNVNCGLWDSDVLT